MRSQNSFQVQVNEGIELLTVIQVLAKRNALPTHSSYYAKCKDYFKKHRTHPAVRKIQKFTSWKKRNVYPDLTEVGEYIEGFPFPVLHLPDSCSWYEKYGKETLHEYLNLCIAFYYHTDFHKFYTQNIPQYQQWASTVDTEENRGYYQKLQNFYNYQEKPDLYIYLDPLNNWGSHAIVSDAPQTAVPQKICFQTGYWQDHPSWKEEPVFKGGYRYLIWHEVSHQFIGHLFVRYAKEIAALSPLYNKDHPKLIAQRIDDWDYCLNENVVRAITAVLYLNHLGKEEYDKLLQKEQEKGFVYVDSIAKFLLAEQRANPKENFVAVFPRLLSYLSTLSTVKDDEKN